MSKYMEQPSRPVLPLYMAAAVWLVGGLALPLYRLWALVATALVSGAVYLAGRRLCPTRYKKVEVGYHTGVDGVDEMLAEMEKNLDALHQANEDIPDPELSALMDRMEKAGRNILGHLEQHPDQAPQLRRFANHYLPDSVHVLSTYAQLVKRDVKGTNAANIKGEIARNANTIALAFENQLDALFAAQSLDISADLTVLDTILKSQGLTGQDL